MKAEFFDIFGFVGFVILSYIGIGLIKYKRHKNKGYIILIISLLGLIVDGYVVIKTYVLG